MTLKQLHSEVCALGFDEYIKLDLPFTHAAARAIQALHSTRRAVAAGRLFANGQLPLTRINEVSHTGGGTEVLPLVGRAYSMRVFGRGRLTVKDGENASIKDFDCRGERICGALDSGGQIIFEGERSYTVCDLVTYAELFGEGEESIPDGSETVTVDLRRELGDFIEPVSAPTDRHGDIIPGAEISDGVLTLPEGYRGEVRFYYKRLPRLPIPEAADEPLDIPEEYGFLLSLLTASYLLLDCDAEKSEYYRRLCEEAIPSMTSKKISADTVLTNGWA